VLHFILLCPVKFWRLTRKEVDFPLADLRKILIVFLINYDMVSRLRKKFEEMTNPRKVVSFSLIIILTIVVTRLFTFFVHNPSPMIFNFEIHHFDYGLALLMWTSLLVIFGKREHLSHLVLFGISFGLIIDDVWFIRSNILEPTTNELILYGSTLVSALVLTGIVLIIAIAIWKISQKRKKLFD